MNPTQTSVTAASSDEARVDALVDELLEQFPPESTDRVTFLGEQFDRGLAWVHFPNGKGGLGLNPKLQRNVNEKVFGAGGPNTRDPNPIGYGMCGPTVVAWGSDDQRHRYLRPLFTGEEMWCQLFSEPGAGSDFAGLSSRGVRDGDEWVVNGQKVWTSFAHVSRWGLLVVRTDPDVVKHAGLTAFVVDMRAPGVEVRPLRQMTGEFEFNEVYFTDARIPDSERLGEVGEGWRVSLTTLMNERVSIGGSVPARGSGAIAQLMTTFHDASPERRETKLDDVVKLWSRAEVLRLTSIRANQTRKMGDPGPEGSIGKLALDELNKDIWSQTIDVVGAGGLLYGSYAADPDTPMADGAPQMAFLRSRANSIEGGTTEVMKNIIGERVLGLPGDVRVDRDVPWNQVPRN
jgi:alkylation response protein AidB-like acyl-CoA dehydrogenase